MPNRTMIIILAVIAALALLALTMFSPDGGLISRP